MAARKSARNGSWHLKHPLSRSATLEQRVNWHLAHAKHCACRPMPVSVTKALHEKAWKTCTRGHKRLGPGPCPYCWPGSRRKREIKRN